MSSEYLRTGAFQFWGAWSGCIQHIGEECQICLVQAFQDLLRCYAGPWWRRALGPMQESSGGGAPRQKDCARAAKRRLRFQALPCRSSPRIVI